MEVTVNNRPIRPSRPATRPGTPTQLKNNALGLEIRKIFAERQSWGRPCDHLHNRVYGPRIGGDQ